MAMILYGRVSTIEQTAEHQLTQAKAAEFKITEAVFDNGTSGVSTRLVERTEGRRLFDKLRAGDVLVVRWVDRLGRNYDDVVETIREFMRRGVVIKTVINGMTFNGATKDPVHKAVRDALIAFMAATAQAQAEATKAAQRAGIDHAKQSGERKYLGRKPGFTRQQFKARSEAQARVESRTGAGGCRFIVASRGRLRRNGVSGGPAHPKDRAESRNCPRRGRAF